MLLKQIVRRRFSIFYRYRSPWETQTTGSHVEWSDHFKDCSSCLVELKRCYLYVLLLFLLLLSFLFLFFIFIFLSCSSFLCLHFSFCGKGALLHFCLCCCFKKMKPFSSHLRFYVFVLFLFLFFCSFFVFCFFSPNLLTWYKSTPPCESFREGMLHCSYLLESKTSVRVCWVLGPLGRNKANQASTQKQKQNKPEHIF